MRIGLLKSSNDESKFSFFKMLGAEVQEIQDLEKTDDKIKELVKNDYKTIIMTDEVASFSESIIKRYGRSDDVKIIIIPQK